jgi:ABC-2 type transport system ATP-binding protein
MATEIIHLEGLTKFYGRNRGVIDLSFSVYEGEVFGFLGPNGAGKTTTIRQLMGLIRPDAGIARIRGLDCWHQAVAVKRFTGYLPGELSLDPDLTGRQILTYLAHLRGGVDARYLAELIDRLGLDPTRRFRQYSHGNKQKVGLIQAFMHRPALLILDEPTLGLDPLNQAEFARLVEEVRADGRTVFLSSHILGEVERLCDRAAIIREGRLVRAGSVRDLRDIKQHYIDVAFAVPVDASELRLVAGVQQVQGTDGRVFQIIVQGDIDPLIKTIARYPVASLASREPTLEEAFLRLYQPDEKEEGKSEQE